METFDQINAAAVAAFGHGGLAWYLADALCSAVEERNVGQDARVIVESDCLLIDTRISRDPLRSSNGGEYNYWTVIRTTGGMVVADRRSSCDFWQPQDAPEPTIAADRSAEVVQFILHHAQRLGVPVTRKGG